VALRDQPIIKPRNKDAPKGSQKLNRKATVFAVCLIIAGFFWVITTLSMVFTTTIKFPVQYINLPKDKLISNNLPDSVEMEIKATGFDIVRCRWKRHLDAVLVDASAYKPHKGSDYFFITTNSKIENIARQIGNDLHVLSVIPDTIFLNFSKKVSRLVPVRAEVKLNFQKEFQQCDSVLIYPKEIKISGSPALVEKVKELRVMDINTSGLNKTVTLRRAIVLSPEFKQLELSVDSVSIHIPVTKFTEGVQEITVEPIHVPAGASLKVFPDKIRITYLVPFDAFDKIKPDMFRAVTDFDKLETGSSKIKVELVKMPGGIRSVAINPDRVEYILRK
jgi:YbbR domain-containing protein